MDLSRYYNLLLDFDQEARFEKLSAPLIYEDIGRKWCCLNLRYWRQRVANEYI